MRFPLVIRHRKAEVRIYGKSKNYAFYRVAAYVGGKRRMAATAPIPRPEGPPTSWCEALPPARKPPP
jgi:hypothetical protein